MTAPLMDHLHDDVTNAGSWSSHTEIRAVYAPDEREITMADMPEYLRLFLARVMFALQATVDPRHGFAYPLELALIERASSVVKDVVPDGDARLVPSVQPTFDGGLVLEWHVAGLDADIYFAADGETTTEASAGGELQFDGDLRTHFEDLYKQLWQARERL